MPSLIDTFKKTLRRPRYERLISVNISRENLLHNLELFQKTYPKTPICPVLKANSYGHGLREIATILAPIALLQNTFAQNPIPFVVVDSYYEALVIKKILSRRQDILIIGFTPVSTLRETTQANFIFTLTSIEQIRQIAKEVRSERRFHIKIDTGMHRQGIAPSEVPEAIALFKSSPHLVLEGVCSHLAESDNEDPTFTKKQIALWNEVVAHFKKEFEKEGGHSSVLSYHLTNTAGADHLQGAEVTATRLGVGLYGIVASTHKLFGKVKPVLEMKTIVTGVKKLAKGESVGYDRTFTASHDMTIATIPVGYFEGLDRRLSNKGFVQIQSADGKTHDCPILGRVSMDITSIDVSVVPDAKIGAPVIAVSRERAAKNSVESIAALCGTIPYDILVHIPEGLHREII